MTANFIVTKPVAFGPEPSDTPRTALEILADHPSLRQRKPGQSIEDRANEIAAQCVLAGQWKPYEGSETMSTEVRATALDRITQLEQRLASQERELSDLRRQKLAPANRMKDAGDNR